jgi:hypothetical protein
MDLTSEVVRRGSSSPDSTRTSSQQEKLDKATDSLTQLAAENEVPVTLARLADLPSASSPEGAALNMALDGSREYASKNDYGSAAESFESLFKAAANSPTKALHLLIQTGAHGLDAEGKTQASLYGGAEGTGQLIRFLRPMADRYGVTLKTSVVTDKLNVPVVRQVNRALGIFDPEDTNNDEKSDNNPHTININSTHPTSIETAPSGHWTVQDRTGFLNDLNPDAVISVGQSAKYSGAKSLLEPAKALEKPPFAFSGYNEDGSARATVNSADQGMVAKTADEAVATFMSVLAGRQGANSEGTGGSVKSLLPSVYRVSQAYEAAAKSGAIFDDARFAAGVDPDTLSVGALVGSRNLLYRDLATADPSTGSSREPTGLEQFTARYPGVLAQHDGSAQAQMEGYNRMLQNAQPGKSAKDQRISLPFLYSQAKPSEKARIGALAGASAGATVFLGAETVGALLGHKIPMDAGYAITAVGGFGTAFRQYWITKVAGSERLAALRGVSADTAKQRQDLRSFGSWLNGVIDRSMANEPTADANSTRRRSNFVMTGLLTYPVSITADLFTVVHPSDVASAGQWALRVGAGAAAVGLGMVEAQYTREALSTRLGPDGRTTSDPTFNPGKFGKVVDMARIPLAASGVANMLEINWLGHVGFDAVTTVPNYIRNMTNVDKAAGVWLWQPREQARLKAQNDPQGPNSRAYETYDLLAATWPGTGDTIWVSANSLNPQVENGAASLASLFGEAVTHVFSLNVP